ncbi:MAG: bifunctional biotin--[acetyl-CoA-carboxylase] ligase/biotin operon repressor BirA [Methylomonas sp.]|jgi:BirA family biotin operon repressor/biotin-[acetyl-CoA-carboxylase] ligase|uniref:bifunctional biotin--[acetyl-CoA-carboxylase] ligase/biotin operon repressor BirA n=1 Tax=Methylomonas sp. TaxID=418 RepID=UPI00260062AC|nr:bifunctional biotin--[acetyl-CoA-carboxylase] ligase/biotin operon repressor BirA [Methylomonas sp.]MCK9605855.1 bifunctional biotin--[acetyl-CoA-carboxylase] ligase/biotin operon repressor BirA [Methylomonas sp.]
MSISDQLVQLLSLLADGRFHSGTELARVLDVSRSAVWKHLHALDDLGIELVGVSGKGYKLQRPMQLLDRQHIHDQLESRAKALISELEIYPAIASTNGYLLELAQRSQSTGRVCLAEYQTAGKGRRGRAWVSPFGHNIYLSILWRYHNGPGAIAGLSLALGVAVVRALSRAGVQEVGLKWPNDIYWRERKLAGILIEVSGESSGPCHAVIGLGLNLYLPEQQAEAIEQAWVDLRYILGDGITQQRNRLVALLLSEMLPVIADFEERTLQGFIDDWRNFDCMQGRAVNIYIGEQTCTGIVRGIDDQGLLLLEDEQGRLRAFASGEVGFRSI